MADGSIKIDTKIDQAGVKKGLNEMNKNVRDTVGQACNISGKASLRRHGQSQSEHSTSNWESG